MQSPIRTVVIASVLLLPPLASAQSSEPLTRADVRAQLVQLEQAGYSPYTNDWRYPNNLRHAEARVAQQQEQASSAYGPASNGTVQSGN